jgi:hypothetical protein
MCVYSSSDCTWYVDIGEQVNDRVRWGPPAETMKVSICRDVTPCSLVDIYQTTRCYITEHSNLQTEDHLNATD